MLRTRRGGRRRAARLFETAVREKARGQLLLGRDVFSGRGPRIGRPVGQLRPVGSRESPPPRAGRGAARHSRAGLFFAKLPLTATRKGEAYCDLPQGVAAAVIGRSQPGRPARPSLRGARPNFRRGQCGKSRNCGTGARGDALCGERSMDVRTVNLWKSY